MTKPKTHKMVSVKVATHTRLYKAKPWDTMGMDKFLNKLLDLWDKSEVSKK